MLIDGEIGPAQMLEGRLSDPHLRELAAKVQVVECEEMERLCQLFEQGDPAGRFASTVTIRLSDGREFYSGLVDGGLRFPQPGWDEARMAEKFRWLTHGLLAPRPVDDVLEMVRDFRAVPNAGKLMALLTD
jgi:2-methylcitrate dehydratase PrpD